MMRAEVEGSQRKHVEIVAKPACRNGKNGIIKNVKKYGKKKYLFSNLVNILTGRNQCYLIRCVF